MRLGEAEAAAAQTAKDFEEFRAEAEGLRNQDLTLRRAEERARSLEARLAEKVRWALQGSSPIR